MNPEKTSSKTDGRERENKTALPRIVDETAHDASQLIHGSGGLRFGRGLIATIVALVLGFLSLLGVLAFHFPQYLTTPELRHVYSVETMRTILFGALIVTGSLALASIVLDNRRRLNGLAFVFVLLAVMLSGSRVPVGEFPDHTPYIGLDWFILDLLGSTMIFVLLEKAFPLYRKQPVFRPEWQTDMAHFAVNHFIVGLVLLVVNFLIHRAFGWMANAHFQQAVQHIWFVPQLLMCMLVADLMEYVTHRAYHEVPFLWRFHAVHHSVRTMDWLAGSRQHILELIVTRVAVLGPLFVFGFEKSVVDAYIIIVGFQAVFNHANVHLPWGPLRYIFVTPDFHHWHHSSEDEAIDRNYATHFAFIDHLFGTAVKSTKTLPEKYGVVGDYVPDGFVRQQCFPFRRDESE
ncbi:sterol desaturase family protein [Burkholderia pyrrocinia]|uniref:sterol desaturase family protein n=1 Tax=Burkholderia pyrrocinia TaxID=60550 RepID=UPI00158CD71E|nr:sterol desaturase family protein [Burkholderia pyrrocinia]